MVAKKTTPVKTNKFANTDYDRWSDNGGSVKPVGTKSKYATTTKKKGK